MAKIKVTKIVEKNTNELYIDFAKIRTSRDAVKTQYKKMEMAWAQIANEYQKLVTQKAIDEESLKSYKNMVRKAKKRSEKAKLRSQGFVNSLNEDTQVWMENFLAEQQALETAEKNVKDDE